MILLRTEINTTLVDDCFIITIRDKDVTINWYLSEILRKYHEWHPFKVYEFEISKMNKIEILNTDYENDSKLLPLLNISETEFRSNTIKPNQQFICEIRESEKSELQRKADQIREEELRLERLRIEAEKKQKRIQRMKEISLRGNCWELQKYSQFLNVPLYNDDSDSEQKSDIDEQGQFVVNTGSLDQWCSIRFVTAILPSFNKFFFSVEIVSLPHTTNTWKICIGAVPIEFKIDSDRHWIGSQHSWSYIAGTGGKCYNSGKSLNYGQTYSEKDTISILIDFEQSQIEFFKNDKSQGIAFKNVCKAVIPAVSLTAKGCKLKILDLLNNPFMPEQIKPFMSKNVQIIRNYIKKREYYLSNKFELLQNEIWNIEQINMFYPRFSSYHNPASLYFSNSKCDKIKDLKNVRSICNIVRNNGSGDKWRIARSFGAYYPSSEVCGVEFEILTDTKSSNTWRICCGVIPIEYNPESDKLWVGAQHSWSYIAGTGGKCHNTSQSASYGERYKLGDRVQIIIDFTKLTLEFFKNRESQGIAFSDCHLLKSGVYAATSLTAPNSCVKFNSMTKSEAVLLQNEGIKQRELLENIVNKYGNTWDIKTRNNGLSVTDKLLLQSTKGDRWYSIASLLSYKSGRRYFEIELLSNNIKSFPHKKDKKNKDRNDRNEWQLCVGVVPKTFNFNHSKPNKLCIGAQNSWALVLGNGGKCFNSTKSGQYTNETFSINDTIGVLMDFDNHTLEFYKNDKSLGQAFSNLYGPVYAAVSIGIPNCKIRFRPEAENEKMDDLFLFH